MIHSVIQLIGEGNVAFHLARGLAEVEDVKEVQVYSRKQKNKQLFEDFHPAIKSYPLEMIKDDATLTIIAVSDDAIPNVAGQLRNFNSLVVHTSGSTSIHVLAREGIGRYGSFYPLQTFSMARLVQWKDIPILTDASETNDIDSLDELALALSGSVHRADDVQRQSTHVAAVMVNNFVNHLYALGDQWLDHHGLPFEVLKSLIRETVDKLDVLTPLQSQTGPARRHDFQTIAKHIELLANRDDMVRIYRLITQSIVDTYPKND